MRVVDIDLGRQYLARLEIYDESNLRCVRMVPKDDFVKDALRHHKASEIFPSLLEELRRKVSIRSLALIFLHLGFLAATQAFAGR